MFRRRKVLMVLVALALLLLGIPLGQVLYVKWYNPGRTVPMRLLKLTPHPIEWIPLSQLPPSFRDGLLFAEDTSFYEHSGFDFRAVRAQAARMFTGERPAGASTITQQCARSLFLWQGRSWIRKGLEAYYTVWMECLLSKARILELYVNVIEYGDGIYGAGAAVHLFFAKDLSQLTNRQIALMIAALPSPRRWGPTSTSPEYLARTDFILSYINALDGSKEKR